MVAASLIESNVMLCDTTPFVLLALPRFKPFQSPEDYERWYIASMIRLLRFASAFFALPALYIAITFHPGMLPSKLALSIAASREGVPFRQC